jgi:hypothetical protein
MVMAMVTAMKNVMIFFEVVTRLARKRRVASSPRPVAVQCPRRAKWQEIRMQEMIRQEIIFGLSLN